MNYYYYNYNYSLINQLKKKTNWTNKQTNSFAFSIFCFFFNRTLYLFVFFLCTNIIDLLIDLIKLRRLFICKIIFTFKFKKKINNNYHHYHFFSFPDKLFFFCKHFPYTHTDTHGLIIQRFLNFPVPYKLNKLTLFS